MAAILTVGATAFDLGLLTVALTLPGVLIAWFAGGWVDRHPRRPLLIATDLLRAVALSAIPVTAALGALSLPLLYAVAVVTGVCSMLFALADHVYITQLVSKEHLLEANARRETADAVAEITGPALGGMLVAWLTAPIAIAADAFTFVASAVLIGHIGKREAVAPATQRVSYVDDVRTGLSVVWRNPAIRTLFVTTATMTLFGSFMASLYTLFALRYLAITPGELGVVIGCGGVGALIGAALAAPAARRLGTRRTLICALAAGAAMQTLIPLAPETRWIALTFLTLTQVLGDGAFVIYLVNETTLRQRLLPPQALGRAASTWQVAQGLLTPIGALIGAALVEWVGMRPTLWLMPAGFALAALHLVMRRRTLPGE
jgi:MFS family permease